MKAKSNLHKRSKTEKLQFPWEAKTVQLDLHEHAFWDEEWGCMLNKEGIKKLLDASQDEADMCWQFDEVEIAEHDGSLFILHFTRAVR